MNLPTRVNASPIAHRRSYRVIKRLMEVVSAAVGLFLLSAFLLVQGTLVKPPSRGAAF